MVRLFVSSFCINSGVKAREFRADAAIFMDYGGAVLLITLLPGLFHAILSLSLSLSLSLCVYLPMNAGSFT